MLRVTWRAPLMRVGLVSLLALALGGCAAQAGQTSAVMATPTNGLITAGTPDGSADPTPASVPTATFVVIPGTPGAFGPACQAKQLSLTIMIDESTSGISTEMGKVTNHSSSACSLFGFPGAQLLDAQRAPMAIQVLRQTSGVWSGVFPEEHVQIAPGASAYFAVAWSAIPTGAQTNCPASGYFAMTPPDDSSAVTAEDPTHVCGGAITISPFTNAPFMGS